MSTSPIPQTIDILSREKREFYRGGRRTLKYRSTPALLQLSSFGSDGPVSGQKIVQVLIRSRRQLAEEKAAKTAVQMLFPLILFIFPGIFVVLIGPAAIQIMEQLLK